MKISSSKAVFKAVFFASLACVSVGDMLRVTTTNNEVCTCVQANQILSVSQDVLLITLSYSLLFTQIFVRNARKEGGPENVSKK
jgi:hypothetical protein